LRILQLNMTLTVNSFAMIKFHSTNSRDRNLNINYSVAGVLLISFLQGNNCLVDDRKPLASIKKGSRVASSLPHQDEVFSLAFSPDGQTIACGQSAGVITLWNARTFRVIRKIKSQSEAVSTIAFSPDGKTILGGTLGTLGPGEVMLWDRKTGKLKWRAAIERTPSRDGPPHPHMYSVGGISVLLVAYSSADKLISGSDDGYFRFWDVQKGKTTKVMKVGAEAEIWSFAASSNGRQLATSDRKGNIKLWNESSPAPVRVLASPIHLVKAIALAPTGRFLAAGYEDGTVLLWNLTKGTLQRELRTTGQEVTAIDISSDGELLAVGNSKGEVLIYRTALGRIHQRMTERGGEITSISFSPPSRTVAYASKRTVNIWRLK